MITISHLTAGYSGNELIHDTSATFPDASVTLLVGRNGVGKSTLLRLLAGLHPKFTGEVLINGKPLREMNAAERALAVSLVTTGRTTVDAMRVRDLVALGRAPYTGWLGTLRSADRRAVAEAMHVAQVDALAGRQLSSLSDGQLQRAFIARAIAQDTPVMLLDEPTSFLDIPGRLQLAEILRDLAHNHGKTIIYSTHDLLATLAEADNVALLAENTLTVLPTTSTELRPLLSRHLSLPER